MSERRDGLLKWIGSKQRSAVAIAALLPSGGTYWEPFVGGAAVLGTLRPKQAVASDVLAPLVELWRAVQARPDDVAAWYAERWHAAETDKRDTYLRVRAAYNAQPNPADLLFLARACYGGVIRFRADGGMNTPCGAHRPIAPVDFEARLRDWHQRVQNVRFDHADFADTMAQAQAGDVVYCDPPYVDSQRQLYGAHGFSLARLFTAITEARDRGVRVALSIDGWKRSGTHDCAVEVPQGLFASSHVLPLGRSMLRRFQMGGQTLEREQVSDRLLCTW